MDIKKLKRSFFARPTLEVAPNLIGKILVSKLPGETVLSRITEVEVYRGEDDLACHASKGRTPRTEGLYGKPGTAYVYLIYGMYYCFNVVTEKIDYPAAVLIRAAEPLENGTTKSLVGPGRLCRELNITKKIHGQDLIGNSDLWFGEDGIKVNLADIETSKRVGVEYARESALLPWRFYLRGSKFVSKLK